MQELTATEPSKEESTQPNRISHSTFSPEVAISDANINRLISVGSSHLRQPNTFRQHATPGNRNEAVYVENQQMKALIKN